MLEMGRSSYSAGATGAALPGKVETPEVGVLATSLDAPLEVEVEAPLKFSMSACEYGDKHSKRSINARSLRHVP